MARRIIWSKESLENKYSIFEYWNTVTGNKKYSIKLDELFNISVELLSIYPKIGRKSDHKDIRVKVVKKYLIIYEIFDTQIGILTIWDSQQNPKDLERLIQTYNSNN